jgi:alanyl-tRNA synthetase
MDANQLRRVFSEFFIDRGHASVPSSGLIPHHPKAPLFTNAGMNQFLPYFLGEEAPPHPRATSVQKCVRIMGKHDDIENIGRSRRHVTFFEMLGNFSFGDYFKDQAIPLAWELSTEGFGLDGDRIWVTVHHSDDEAAQIWHDVVGLPAERIQRMGEDNFWEMGESGPCGPCSELYYDRGPEYGDEGGPERGGEERYAEFWNLVFMQYDRQPGGELLDLPRKNIDTGAGFERLLMLLQGVDSVFDTDVLRPIVAEAETLTGRRYGDDDEADVRLRILADHARSMTFLVNDGVFPSNEERGYVLRRIIRRAVQFAYSLGVEKIVTPALVGAVVDVMGEAYPDLLRNRDFVQGVVGREEERFRSTLKSGLGIFEAELDQGRISGEVAFKLHDTFGFPVDITRELAAERGVEVDVEGFRAAMDEQRTRAREAAKNRKTTEANLDAYREVLDQFGTTEFTGYSEYESKARVLAVVPAAAEEGKPDRLEIFLDRTPFYAEQGGQVGDTGGIDTETGAAEIVDTTFALPGLIRHLAVVTDGTVSPGQEATAKIDAERRNAIRRNHTGTHILHWALREVLGTHVRQHGSLVSPDALRFDFSHYSAVTPEELRKIEDLANARILADEPVRAYETSKAQAEQMGAIAFFEEKYGDVVRVVEAGSRSMELCGGTHVSALGMIGPVNIVSEGSIGANMRRIFALTGTNTVEHTRQEESLLDAAAELLRTKPDELPAAIEREITKRKELEDELKSLRAAQTRSAAAGLQASAIDGIVVSRVDGIAADQLKDLAVAVRDSGGMKAVVLIGSPDGQRVALVAATGKESGIHAPTVVGEAAKAVGGGGGGKDPTLGTAGGRDATAIDAALEAVRARLLPA